MRAHAYLGFISLTSIFLLKINTFNCELDVRERTPAFFSANLFSALRSAKVKNQLISPYSVQSSLAIAFIGSQNETAAQIHTYAELSGSKDKVAKTFGKALKKIKDIKSRTIIYLSKSRKNESSEFQKRFAKNFGKDKIHAVDFSNGGKVTVKINQFVKSETDQRIKNFIEPRKINQNIKASMINTLNFHAKWESPFKEVEEQNFYKSTEETHGVEMMQQHNKFLHGDLMVYGLDAEALVLPFANTKTVMLILLPKKLEGLELLLNALTHFDVTKIPKILKKKMIRVHFPQLKLNLVEPLKAAVQNMGIIDSFKSKANFGNLMKNIQIKDMQQEVVIEASPKEVRGFAATSIVWQSKLQLSLRSASDNNYFKHHKTDNSKSYIDVDHPFFYAIINGDNILFQGTIKNV